MKKPLLLSALLLASASIFAQPTIQSSDFYPTIGESFSLNYGNYVSPGSGGNNVTWDLSGMSSSSVITVNALAPSSSFPTSTMHLEYVGQSSLHTNLTSTEFLVVGETTSSATANYTDAKKLYQFPMTNGASYADNFSGSIVSSGVTFSRTGSVTSEVDGYGTLITPSGTYTNVVRVHSVHTSNDTYMGQTITGTIDMYSWIKAGVHIELAVVQEITAMGNTQTVGWYSSNTLGISDNTINTLVMHPNPAQDIVSLQHEQDIDHVEVRDLNGRLAAVEFNAANNSIDVSRLSTGVYYVTVYSNNASTVQKLMKR